MVSSVCCLLPVGTSDRATIGFSLVLPSRSFDCRSYSDDNSNMYFRYRANYDLFGDYLYTVDWLSIMSKNPSADQLWHVFLAILKLLTVLYIRQPGITGVK